VTRRLTALLERPSGLFVVAGPTGSGKTTTLYTALAHLNDGRRKLISVEDPIEYDLPGVEQVQVNPQVGLTFAAVLRAALRQDPDILMVGEIRDGETAEIAARAALIGRLVLATIHTGSPEAVRTRLVDLGVPAYLVDDVLLGVLSQRLQVTACPSCAGEGCEACRWSGLGARRPEVRLVEYASTADDAGSAAGSAPQTGAVADLTGRGAA
jgi:general secretion pathway protein E